MKTAAYLAGVILGGGAGASIAVGLVRWWPGAAFAAVTFSLAVVLIGAIIFCDESSKETK